MAKKPPQNPNPPIDDFDPDRDIFSDIVPDDVPADEVAPLEDDLVVSDEIVEPAASDAIPIDDDLIVGVPDDDLVDVVDDKGATQLVTDDIDVALPDVEVADDLVVTEVTDVDDLVVDDGPVTDNLVVDDVDQILVEEDALVSKGDDFGGDDDLVVDTDLIDVEPDDLSPHEASTAAAMPALRDDADPFAGVGDDLEGTVEPGEGELVGAGVGDGGGGDDEPYVEEEIPKPGTHWFTWTLIGLNIIAALVAPYLIVMSLSKRQAYTYAVLQHDLAMMGLPTEEEEKTITAAKGTIPIYRISPAEIKRIVADRIGAQSDKFEGVEESLVRPIPPSMLTPEILKEHFGEHYVDSPEPITTVEAEVRRIEKSVVPLIKKAAQESLEKSPSEDAKRQRIIRMLHPLAMDVHQSEALEKTIKDAKGAELDKLYIDAVERRMAFDFLLPLELFRPGDSRGMFIETMGDLKKLPTSAVLDRVKERLNSTIDKNYQPAIHLGEEWSKQERDTIEKRLTVAFTLLSLAHVKKPDGELLDPKLLDRIPLVVGQYDFAVAAELFPSRLMKLNEKVLERIRIDREGFETPDKDGNLVRSKAFIDYYEDELQRIRFKQQDIAKAKLRLEDLQTQKARYETLLTERTEQRAKVLAKIAAARAKTSVDAAELRRYQDDLFRYQIELATSEEDLARVNQEIEEKYGKKGAKQP